MIGMIVTVMGILILASSNQQLGYYGLGMLVTGMGLSMPTNPALLDNLYEKKDPLRDRGYFYLYVGG